MVHLSWDDPNPKTPWTCQHPRAALIPAISIASPCGGALGEQPNAKAWVTVSQQFGGKKNIKNHKEPEANRLSLTSTPVEKSRNEKERIWTVKSVKIFGTGGTVQVSRVRTPRPYAHTNSKEGFHGCIWRWPTVPLTAFRRGPAECQRVQYFVAAAPVLASLQVSQN